MATILAHITVKPGKEREFEDLAERLVKATHDNETRVIRYEYWRGAPSSNTRRPTTTRPTRRR
jgi:quinol monooxygenase YgiN